MHAPHAWHPAARPWHWIGIVFALYALVFVAFYPSTFLVHDETFYVRQALAFARSSSVLPLWSAATHTFVDQVPSYYPPGTSLFMAPPVHHFGVHAVFLVPWIASVVFVLATAAWLRNEGHSPLFALLLLIFPPTPVLARLAMSDVPSAGMIAVALLCFSRSASSALPIHALSAGFLCGTSLSVRETNPLLLLPLFAGAVLRRDRHAWALVLGSVVGAGLRPLLAYWLFDDPFFHKSTGAGFSTAFFLQHLPFYLFVSLVFVPGGLLWVWLYRGPRRLEIVGTVLGFLALYSAYHYIGSESGLWKSLILGPRFLIPLLPLFALCAAQAYARFSRHDSAFVQRVTALVPAMLVAGAVLVPVATTRAIHDASAKQTKIERAMAAHMHADDVIVSNTIATQKHLTSLDAGRKLIDFYDVDDLRTVLRTSSHVKVVLLQRDDSPEWRSINTLMQQRLQRISREVRLRVLLDTKLGDEPRLTVFEVSPR